MESIRMLKMELDFPQPKMVSIEIVQPTPLQNLTVHWLGFLTDAFQPDHELLKMRVCLQTSKA